MSGFYPLTLKPNSSRIDTIYHQLEKHYKGKIDPWGLNLEKHRRYFEFLWPFYTHYFRVKMHHKEQVKDKPYVIVANHSGQIAIDALLLMVAFAYETSPPRIIRPMIERFLPKLPFIGEMVAKMGCVLGDRKNCTYLLERGESILAFPEGVKGISKSTPQFYSLQHFSHGFIRMALAANAEVLPIAVVGAEEFYPFVYQFSKLAKWLKLPSFPVTPIFPFFGPLGILPMPSPVDIYVGKPYAFPTGMTSEASDHDISRQVSNIKRRIQTMIDKGLEKKRDYFGNVEKTKRKRR